MSHLRLAALVIAGCMAPASAQAQMSNQPGYTGPTQTPEERRLPPLPGANSFTEEQARERIATAGYSEVAQLRLDEQGVWRGVAKKDGREHRVALDYRGNIVQYQ